MVHDTHNCQTKLLLTIFSLSFSFTTLLQGMEVSSKGKEDAVEKDRVSVTGMNTFSKAIHNVRKIVDATDGMDKTIKNFQGSVNFVTSLVDDVKQGMQNSLVHNKREVQAWKELHDAAQVEDLSKILSLVNQGVLPGVTDLFGQSALHKAVKAGKSRSISLLIELGVPVDVVDSMGKTPLHYAVSCGQLDIVGDLLEVHKAQSMIVCKKGYTPLHEAVRFSNIAVIKKLQKSGVKINTHDVGYSPLHLAASLGKLDALKYLLTQGARLSVRCLLGSTPLHSAAESNQKEVICLLLKEYCVDPNQRTSEGLTCLHIAVSKDFLQLTELLKELGADLEVQDKQGKTALHYAVDLANVSIVEMLLKLGAGQQARDRLGLTPLHLAVKNGYTQVITLLLRESTEALHVCCNCELAPFHYAILEGRLHVVKLIVQLVNEEDEVLSPRNGFAAIDQDLANRFTFYAAHSGDLRGLKCIEDYNQKLSLRDQSLANSSDPVEIDLDDEVVLDARLLKTDRCSKLLVIDPNVTDDNGMTPVHHAARNGFLHILGFLMKLNPELDVLDMFGYSPLHYASMGQSAEIVSLLIQQEASVNLEDSRGQLPLHLAAQKGTLEVIRTLQGCGASLCIKDTRGRSPYECAKYSEREENILQELSRSTVQIYSKQFYYVVGGVILVILIKVFY